MYGPIANLPGYNPNATYLPPGMAAPSSYPEWKAPTQQFYDMPALPSVVDSSINALAQGGLSSSDRNDSAFGPTGISGGIGGPDGMDYAFLNFLNRYSPQQPQGEQQQRPEQMVPPNYSGPSNDQYSGDYFVPPTFGGPQQWSFENYDRKNPTVSFQEEGQGWSGGQSPYAQPSWPQGFYQSSTPLQPFDIQPTGLNQSQLDRLGQLPSLPNQIGDRSLNTAGNVLSMFSGPLGAAFNGVNGFVTGLNGNRMPGDPDAGFLQRMIDPREPGMVASAANWLGRQLSPAEESLQKAYSQTDRYDPNTGQYASASPASVSIAAPGTDFGGGTFGNGEWKPWYDGNPDPFSMTGNMNAMASWGPGTKYVMQPFDTN